MPYVIDKNIFKKKLLIKFLFPIQKVQAFFLKQVVQKCNRVFFSKFGLDLIGFIFFRIIVF